MGSEKIYKVFVSSTFEDLREERSAVQKGLLQLGCLPVGMELFPAADEETWNFIKSQIDDSDYYVVVVAGRYGSRGAAGISFTEMEYDYAIEQKKPAIAFVHAEPGSIAARNIETSEEAREKLKQFIAKIRKRPVRQFKNPHELALEVTTSFVQLMRDRPAVGYVRTDESVDFKRYSELLEENNRLKEAVRAAPMTYSCGILVRDGLVMFADTRTNAGVDNIATFRRLHVMTLPGERIMAIASAGNLSISQSVVSIVREGWKNPESGEVERLSNARTMFQAAQHVGHIVRKFYEMEGKALDVSDVNSFLLGGQIKGERPRLFLIYAAGNFIECTGDTPYLQIGEHKYGKPVLDRAISYDIDLYDALKVGLVSVDSTMRSNVSVGLPIDVLIARRDACDAELNYRIEPGEPYFQDMRERWSAALRAAHAVIPRPPYRNIR
jgi:putative proteasome-type protease